jgi:hypothetical protein
VRLHCGASELRELAVCANHVGRTGARRATSLETAVAPCRRALNQSRARYSEYE